MNEWISKIRDHITKYPHHYEYTLPKAQILAMISLIESYEVGIAVKDEALKDAQATILIAITGEDGLDGGEGNEILNKIEEVLTATSAEGGDDGTVD